MSATFTNLTKHSATFSFDINYLLQQTADYLLQENDDKIVLQRSPAYANKTAFTNLTKN